MGEFGLAILVGALAGVVGAWLFGLRQGRHRGRGGAGVGPGADAAATDAAPSALVARLTALQEAFCAHAGEAAPAAQDGAALTAGVEQSRAAMDDVVARVGDIEHQVQALTDSVGQTAMAVDEMTFGSLEVAKNISELSRTCEETAAAMVEMDVSISAVDSAANETSRISAQVSKDAETGARALNQTIAGIQRIREGNLLATEVIRELDQKIFAVTKILGVIDDVAEQTNLLALNAAIIAAQAGEHGRGFAVVADEIKALAERTGASTKEIAELILTMQDQSGRATNSMAHGLANVEDGVRLGHNAGEALHKIVDSAQRSTGMSESIAQATVEQAQRSKQVTDAISRIAETVQAVAYATAEQAKGAQHLGQSTDAMRAAVEAGQKSVEAQRTSGAVVVDYLARLPDGLQRLHSLAEHLQQVEAQLADGRAAP